MKGRKRFLSTEHGPDLFSAHVCNMCRSCRNGCIYLAAIPCNAAFPVAEHSRSPYLIPGPVVDVLEGESLRAAKGYHRTQVFMGFFDLHKKLLPLLFEAKVMLLILFDSPLDENL